MNAPLAAITTTPEERKQEGIKGFRKKQVNEFFRDELAPALSDIEQKMIIVMDKGLRFKSEEVKREIKAGGADVEDVWILPTSTAKLVSPLDNCIWHDVKEEVRKQHPKTADETAETMKDVFMALSPKKLKRHFHHCALTTSSDHRKGLD